MDEKIKWNKTYKRMQVNSITLYTITLMIMLSFLKALKYFSEKLITLEIKALYYLQLAICLCRICLKNLIKYSYPFIKLSYLCVFFKVSYNVKMHFSLTENCVT